MDILVIILSVLLVVAVMVAVLTVSKLSDGKRQISTLQEENCRLNETITVLQKNIADRDALVAAGQASIAVLESRVAEAGKQLEKSTEQVQALNERIIALTNENSKFSERISVMNNEKERLQNEARLQFSELATKIFDDKTRKSDDRLNEILNPLKEKIELLKKEINDRSIKDSENHASLKEQIGLLRDLNTQIGKDATYLANALKGNNSVQGNWGEQMLENILSASGLIKGEQFEVQVTKDEAGNTLTNEAGNRLRPDVIVHLPDDKDIIIDSKVSFRAYIDYVNATDEKIQQEKLREHAASVKKHVDELATKSYQDYVGKGDHVMMFVPNEAAYLAAMQADHSLWQYAYDRRVLLLSPTNLIAALKVVADLWQRDKQTRHAIDIAEEAGKLYDKFVGFIDDMEKIGKALGTANTTYGEAMKKLKNGTGNLIGRVEKLKGMGV